MPEKNGPGIQSAYSYLCNNKIRTGKRFPPVKAPAYGNREPCLV